MKTYLCPVLILAAALSVAASSPLSAAPASEAVFPVAYSVQSVDHLGHLIARGTTTMTVLQWLGAPHRQLASDTWVYYGYRADSESANDLKCRTLILTVAGGVVTDIKLVNDHAVRLIAARAKVKPAGVSAASK